MNFSKLRLLLLASMLAVGSAQAQDPCQRHLDSFYSEVREAIAKGLKEFESELTDRPLEKMSGEASVMPLAVASGLLPSERENLKFMEKHGGFGEVPKARYRVCWLEARIAALESHQRATATATSLATGPSAPPPGAIPLPISAATPAPVAQRPAAPLEISPQSTPQELPVGAGDRTVLQMEDFVHGTKVEWSCRAYSCKSGTNERFLRDYLRYQEIDCPHARSAKDCDRHRAQESQIRSCMKICAERLACRRSSLDSGTCLEPYFR